MGEDKDTTESNRAIMTQVVQALFVDNDAEKFAGFVSEDGYIQHNPDVPDGKAAVVEYLRQSFKGIGHLEAKVHHVIVDGDLALTHASFAPRDGSPDGFVLIDIFRLRDGKLVEHWDVSQRMPVAAPGRKPEPEANASPRTDSRPNREIFQQVARALFIDQDAERFAEFVSDESYVQHHPGMPDGKEAAMEFLRPLLDNKDPSAEVRHVLVDGDIGVIHARVRALDGVSRMNIVDMFRLSDGKLVEHWDAMATIQTHIHPHEA